MVVRKPCRRCGGPKEGGSGSVYCADCRIAKMPAWRQADLQRQVSVPEEKLSATPEGMKWCAQCKRYRRLIDFGLSKGKQRSYCRACESLYNFEGRLSSTYGLTLVQYDALAEAQEGNCAICGTTPRSQRLAVDHDHQSGYVRGLLCKKCNHRLLGGASERVELLRAAIGYLENPPAFKVIGHVRPGS